MTLYFPLLHPELLSGAQRQSLPGGVRFLDPGLAKPGSPLHRMPESAPFDRGLARAILADTLRFGESVSSPRDIAAHGLLQQAEALSPESGRLVLAEVERTLAGAGGAAAAQADPLLEARRQAQTLLLLAWSLEERILDLRGIDADLRESWERLGESVNPAEAADLEPHAAESADEGLVDGEALAVGSVLAGMALPDEYADSAPWRRVLEAFAALAPGSDLVTADEAVISALREAGLPERGGVFEAPAWRLAGLDRCPADRPWLDAPLRLAVAALANGAA